MCDFTLPRLVAEFEKVIHEENDNIKINESKLNEIWQIINTVYFQRGLLGTGQGLCNDALYRCVKLSHKLLDKAEALPSEKVTIAAYCKAFEHLSTKNASYPIKIHHDRYPKIVEEIKQEAPVPKDLTLRRLMGIFNNNKEWIASQIAEAQKEGTLGRKFVIACKSTCGYIDFEELIAALEIKDQPVSLICEAFKECLDKLDVRSLCKIPGLPRLTEDERLMIAKDLAQRQVGLETFFNKRPLSKASSFTEVLKVVASHCPKRVPDTMIDLFLDSSYKLDPDVIEQLKRSYEEDNTIFETWDSTMLAVNFPTDFRIQLYENNQLSIGSKKGVVLGLAKESNDPKYALEALEMGVLIDDIPSEMKQNREFLLSLLIKFPKTILNESSQFSFLIDDDLLLEAIKTNPVVFFIYVISENDVSADFYEKALEANWDVAKYNFYYKDFDKAEIEQRCKKRVSAINFAQIVLFSDDFLRLIKEANIPEQDEKKLIKFRRYFDITKQLPMELQMKVANMTQGLAKERITVALCEWAVKHEFAKMSSKLTP